MECSICVLSDAKCFDQQFLACITDDSIGLELQQRLHLSTHNNSAEVAESVMQQEQSWGDVLAQTSGNGVLPLSNEDTHHCKSIWV